MPRTTCFITETEGERRASWIELFYDLVFVVAIANLAHQLKLHLTGMSMAEYVLLFLPVWWVWLGLTYFADQFDMRDWLHQVVLFLTMFAVIVMSIFIPQAFARDADKFAVMYVILRILLIWLYARVWYYDQAAKRFLGTYVVGFSLSALLWLISLFVPAPAKFTLWGVGFLIDLLTPIVAYFSVKYVPAQVSHMDERFGLFVIIVLGETIVSVAFGVRDAHWQWQSIWVCIAGFVIAVMMWLLYFRHANLNSVSQALQQGKKAMRRSFVYGYSHFFLFISMAAFGVGLEAIIDHHLMTSPMMLWLVAGSAVVYLGGISLVHWGIWQLHRHQGWPRLLAAIIIVVTCIWLSHVQTTAVWPAIFLVSVVLICFVTIAVWEQIAGIVV